MIISAMSRADEETEGALTATITCPACGREAVEQMPTTFCLVFYVCPGCGRVLRPKRGDCCVFCSYGDRRCPAKQAQLE